MSGPVSPLAQTVPLSLNERTTDGLAAGGRNPNTARVGSAELDDILRNQRLAPGAGNGDDELSSEYEGEHYAAPTTSSLVLPAGAQTKRRRWWPVVSLTVFFLALTAGLLIYYVRHREANSANAPGVNLDQTAMVTQQLGEARALLAAGNVNDAIERLHSVVNLDPGNVEAHRLLGAAFMRNGRRRQAIDEYFAAAQKDPGDIDTLHTLASLQFQEQLYADAIDTYRRLASAMGSDTAFPPRDQLEYADALRLAGYTEDSRREYQKLVAGAPADIVATARQRLAQLPPETAANVPVNARVLPPATTIPANNAEAPPVSPPVIAPAPVATIPAPAPAKAPAQTDHDTDYSLGVSIVAGRDPRNMPRPELLRALGAAQRAALGGQHREEARRLAERLGREFDRRKSKGIQ